MQSDRGDKKGRNKSGQVLGVRDYISEQLVQIFQGINFFDLLGERDPELFVIFAVTVLYRLNTLLSGEKFSDNVLIIKHQ